MASKTKTLTDFFAPLQHQPSAKRLKQTMVSSLGTKCDADGVSSAGDGPSALSDAEKSRVELHKSIARAKRNLRICAQKVSDSKGTKRQKRRNKKFLSFPRNDLRSFGVSMAGGGGGGYVKLAELLVEETWLEALRGEFEKPYAKSLCKFVETEIRGGAVPVYPPPHLVFNALNSTRFDGVKAVILGQVCVLL